MMGCYSEIAALRLGRGSSTQCNKPRGTIFGTKFICWGDDNLSLGMVIGIMVSGEITVFSYFVVSVGIHS